MSISVEYRPQPPHMPLDYEQHRFPQPQFTNPWHSSQPGPQGSVYQTSAYQQSPTQMEHPQVSRPQPMSMGYTANPAASSLGSDLVPTRSYGSSYAPPPSSTQQMYAHSSPQRFSPEHVPSASYPYEQDIQRRGSYPHPGSHRASISDEMASARGMVAMATNYNDLTPRNGVYSSGISRTSSHDSYGFPGPHSHSSSISSGSAYPYYSNGSYQGSVDGSMTDYSSASEEMVPRTLPAPPPNSIVQGYQAEPGAMMSSFNARMSPSAQKKHKCKICEKRFTRPSSLQTHMYSHTGEKPFACDYQGCGRHFSVVSNLRRHKKVHKEEGAPVSGDEE